MANISLCDISPHSAQHDAKDRHDTWEMSSEQRDDPQKLKLNSSISSLLCSKQVGHSSSLLYYEFTIKRKRLQGGMTQGRPQIRGSPRSDIEAIGIQADQLLTLKPILNVY